MGWETKRCSLCGRDFQVVLTVPRDTFEMLLSTQKKLRRLIGWSMDGTRILSLPDLCGPCMIRAIEVVGECNMIPDPTFRLPYMI